MPLSSECLLIIILCFLTGYFILWGRKRNSKRLQSPPGPWALPIFGNAFQITRRPHLKFSQWTKKYGPIFKVKFGTKDVVVINDHKMIKELFSDGASTGRMNDNPVMNAFSKGPNGIINSEGSAWHEQRQFTIRTLREFGFSKTSMEGLILDEARAFLGWFKDNSDKLLSGNQIFNAPVVNSLWRIVAGERTEWEQTGSNHMQNIIHRFFSASMNVTMKGIMFAPILRFIAPGYFGWNEYIKCLDSAFNLFVEAIRQHKKTFQPNNLRDLIDCHLSEIANATDPKSSFYKQKGEINLVAGIFDLFVAGSETTSATLSWTLLYLSQYQEIQKKLQQEIDQIFDCELPSLTRRQEMPYTEAVILEILRITSLTPLGVPHTIVNDITFHGYDLPKGTSIFANLYGVHHDPDVWGDDVETFRPERFLNEDETNIVRYEAWIPFGDGKRRCLGETLAKDTFFLFLVSIFQQFHVRPSDKDAIADFEGEIGLALLPKPFKIVVSQRVK